MTTSTEHDVAAQDRRPDPEGYDDRGTGEPALLLLPGWCGDRSVLDGLARRLSGSRRTLVTDLRGHGALRSEDDFTSGDVVDDLVALLAERAVGRVVPVALSHAGWLGVELRRRLGAEQVPGLVLMDWMVLGPPPGFTEALAGLQGPEWSGVRAALLAMWTAGTDVPALREYVDSMGTYGRTHWQRAGREIAAAFTAHGAPLDALSELDSPPATLHLYAQPADDGYLAAQQAYAKAHPWFSVHRLEARSHFPMLEAPEDMAALVEQHVRRIPRATFGNPPRTV
jgi:pimeloyl-ACP methyl ester carboxylesterase